MELRACALQHQEAYDAATDFNSLALLYHSFNVASLVAVAVE